MAVLSDNEIKKLVREGLIHIENVDEGDITGASVDLHLGNKFRVFRHIEVTHIDTKKGVNDGLMDLIEVREGKTFIVHPGELVLGITREFIRMPDFLVARLDGRSSLGRLGIVIHSTAGSVDPGFEGNLTLEIANISKVPVMLWPGTKIARLTFDELSSPAEKPYNRKPGAKYAGQREPEYSRIGDDD